MAHLPLSGAYAWDPILGLVVDFASNFAGSAYSVGAASGKPGLYGIRSEINLPIGRLAVRAAKGDRVVQYDCDLPICIRVERPPPSASGISKDVLGVMMATMI